MPLLLFSGGKSTADHAKLGAQIKYLKIYLSTRNLNESYNDFQDISRFVLDTNLGKFSKTVEGDDFDIGFLRAANIRISLDNGEGRFFYNRGFFENKFIDRSRIKIVAGFRDIEDPTDENEIVSDVIFEGFIDDRATKIDERQGVVQIQALSYSDIISRIRTDPGAVTNGQTFKVALFNLLNTREITQFLNVALENINPQINNTIDDFEFFVGKQLKSSINALLLASNSVLKVQGSDIVISGRATSNAVRHSFTGRGGNSPATIIEIKEYNSGMQRVFTQLTLNETEFEADNKVIRRYGASRKQIDIGFVTNSTTISQIAANILGEFQTPKAEVEVTTVYMGDEVDLLDIITINSRGFLTELDPPRYNTGLLYDGGRRYAGRIGATRIDPREGWRVLGITHDFKTFRTTFKLRSAGIVA